MLRSVFEVEVDLELERNRKTDEEFKALAILIPAHDVHEVVFELSTTKDKSSAFDQNMDRLYTSFKLLIRREAENASTHSKELEERMYAKFIQWLSQVPYLAIASGRLPGTGQWLTALPEFVDSRNASWSSLSVVHGPAGRGKSSGAS